MPNWVKNIVRITGPEEDIAKALELIRDKDPGCENRIDFNNIIPRPERLNIAAGGYDRHYVALYLKTLLPSEQYYLRFKLSKCPVSYYGNYLKKYEDAFSDPCRIDISDNIKKRMAEELDREYKSISPTSLEEVGKAYIDNILEYGDDTWYEWSCRNWGTKWNPAEAKFFDDEIEFETAWSAPFPVITELSRTFPKLVFTHEWADENIGFNCGRSEVARGAVTANYGFESDDEAYKFACSLWGYDPEELEDEE